LTTIKSKPTYLVATEKGTASFTVQLLRIAPEMYTKLKKIKQGT